MPTWNVGIAPPSNTQLLVTGTCSTNGLISSAFHSSTAVAVKLIPLITIPLACNS